LFITFGRVPFFYYVVHIFLIHALAVVLAWLVWGDASWLFGRPPIDKPANYGLSLPGVLRHMAVGALGPLSALPLVRRAQAAPYRMVVELSLNGHRDFATDRMMLSGTLCGINWPARESW
jgi:hypothetical protein